MKYEFFEPKLTIIFGNIKFPTIHNLPEKLQLNHKPIVPHNQGDRDLNTRLACPTISHVDGNSNALATDSAFKADEIASILSTPSHPTLEYITKLLGELLETIPKYRDYLDTHPLTNKNTKPRFDFSAQEKIRLLETLRKYDLLPRPWDITVDSYAKLSPLQQRGMLFACMLLRDVADILEQELNNKNLFFYQQPNETTDLRNEIG